MKSVEIKTPYITLGQLLKFLGIASNGGEIKVLLVDLVITVNQVRDERRGRKCYPGDVVDVPGHGTWCIHPCA
jgi:ribosome-associated protein YbcJ (S4-like RNA binding protein)